LACYAARVLAKLLGIRPEDRRDTFVAFATLVAILAAHSMLETARDALFLEKLSPEYLPLAYIVIAVIALFVTKANQAATQRFARRKLLSASLFVGGIATIGFYQLTASLAPVMLGALYVWTGMLATVVVVQFWLQLGDVLDVGQAKRLFSIIAAGGLVGATVGSASAGALLSFFDARALLVVSGCIFMISAALPLGFSPTIKDAPKRRRGTTTPKRQGALREIAGDAYLKRLFLMVLIGAVLATGIDYIFKAKVVAEVENNGGDLGVFFARYYAVVNAIALLVQLLIAPRLISWLKVNGALLVMPGMLLLGSTGFALTIALAPALILKGADGALRHSVHRTASEILYLPLQRRVRERFKGFAEAVGQRGGQALASVAILGVTYFTPNAYIIASGLVVLSGAFVLTMIGLQPHYVELFRKQLRAGTLETEVDVPDLDLASFEVLVQALSSEDDAEVLGALDMFENYDKTNLVPALILYHPSRPVVMRAFEMFARSQRADVKRLTGRLMKHDDDEIRAAALRAMAAADPDEDQLRKHLEDDSPAVRLTAMVALLRAGLVDDDEAEKNIVTWIDSDSEETRLALAQALRYLPGERFDWVFKDLAKVKQRGLSAAIARSVAAAPAERHVPMLIEMLATRDARADARSALLEIGEPALDAIADAMHDRSLPRMLRRHLPRTASRFASQRAASILMDALKEEKDDRVVLKILRGLGRIRANDPSIEVDRDAVIELTERTLRAAITSLHWRLAVGRVVDFKQEAMTPAAELLLAFLDEKWKLAIQRVFRLLHIIEPAQEFRIIYDGLRSDDKKTKASSLELLSLVVPEKIRDGILALVDDREPTELLKSARSFHDPRGRELLGHAMRRLEEEESEENLRELGLVYADHLRAMLVDPSDALRSIVAHHVSELGLEELIAEVAMAQGHSSDVLAQIADRAFGLFSIHPEPEPTLAS
jgi:AAA family ATP:ADP antiporter